ncbi:uncharacterized protein BXZ73DRAFT_93473 [Epithele typhae]|uniref:uncharacterized protein n=1 Tax=Epithele typhae TaxID=378194 RepID=UPI002007DFB4|nr:uncharacterized protein BXZ73DRAFT_93473 [Epithele typhae]KAH9911179.1 hypothetical protein BXZ73DRAFT_93473 [Epithele typhae]
MLAVHVYEGRKWLGWYNTPGSYEIAKRCGQLSRSRFWDGLYPGPNLTPARGSRYRCVQSGTIMVKTGHIASIFQQHCDQLKPQEWGAEAFRITSKTTLVAIIPIFASVVTCVACALHEDWICFAMILAGILANGLSCYWIGSGTLTFTRPEPAGGALPVHGILNDGEQIIILKGPEGAVNVVTRGAFSLDYGCDERYHRIGVCALLLMTQFLAQLLLLPQGTHFGQIMFLTSLAVSWLHNIYLSAELSLNRDSMKRHILMKKILQDPHIVKYTLGTPAAMAVFTLLGHSDSGAERDEADKESLRSLFDELLPNNTPTWQEWKDETLRKVLERHRGALSISQLGVEAVGQPYTPEQPLALLNTLNWDVGAAFCAYGSLCQSLVKEVWGRHNSEDTSKPTHPMHDHHLSDLMRRRKYSVVQEVEVGDFIPSSSGMIPLGGGGVLR